MIRINDVLYADLALGVPALGPLFDQIFHAVEVCRDRVR
jgi:hypothetical protein